MHWLVFFVLMWIVLSRVRRRMWHSDFQPYGGGPRFGRHCHAYGRLRGPEPFATPADHTRVQPAAPTRRSRFEALKQRYVSGELSDEQYEQEIDILLREPGGTRDL